MYLFALFIVTLFICLFVDLFIYLCNNLLLLLLLFNYNEQLNN